MSQNSVTIQLRYLQTLREIGGNESSTIVFPFPVDLLQPLMNMAGRVVAGPGGPADADLATAASADPEIKAAAEPATLASPESTPGRRWTRWCSDPT